MTTKTTHTPGPWMQHEDYPRVIVAVAEPTLSLLALDMTDGHEADPIAVFATDADARLVAAAPELLDALRQWKCGGCSGRGRVDGDCADPHCGESYWEHDCGHDEEEQCPTCKGTGVHPLARAAIAKATGATP